MQTEIELKLAIANSDIPLLQQQPLLAGAPQKQLLHNIYFDTPELDLTQKKMALRLRLVDGLWVQTLKGGGKVEGGLHQRQEWEVPVAGEQLDFAQLRSSPWGELFNADLQSRLQAIFETNFWRSTWLLHMSKGTIELALDVGQVQAKGQTTPICEVELELKSGTADAIGELAAILQASVPLLPENRSKADKGYCLYLGAIAK
jgi:inorganic triphosphatase YgiF